jgi:hypothetical protein
LYTYTVIINSRELVQTGKVNVIHQTMCNLEIIITTCFLLCHRTRHNLNTTCASDTRSIVSSLRNQFTFLFSTDGYSSHSWYELERVGQNWLTVSQHSGMEGSVSGRNATPSFVLEAVSDVHGYSWHLSYGHSGCLNEINSLNRSPLLESMSDGVFMSRELLIKYSRGYSFFLTACILDAFDL